MKSDDSLLSQTPLGKQATYETTYQPDLLCSLSRKTKRDEIGAKDPLPFQGDDIWNAFELSWLTPKGKPVVACAEIKVPAHSPNIFESKSLKLYLISFNQTAFSSFQEVKERITTDLSKAVGATVQVNLTTLAETDLKLQSNFTGTSLDSLDITCDTYHTSPNYLVTETTKITETLHSDLLRSNCLITNQPDWGSVQITYTGNKINHEGLLKYIISLRQHNEFHEQCVERMFMDIMRRCNPEKLCVYARYTRRGGIDINPYRANYDVQLENSRLVRQ